MEFLVFLYGFLIVVGFPLILSGDSPAVGCFQPISLIGSFMTLVSLSFPRVLCRKMANPFSNGGIVVDSLIANSELTSFQTLRILWDMETPELKDSNANEDCETESSLSPIPNETVAANDKKSVPRRKLKRFKSFAKKGEFGEL